MRDAISLTEQCISYSDKEITYKNVCNILCLMPAENINKIINMLISEDANSLLNFIDSLYYESVDFKNLLEEIISILHQSAIFKVTNVINDNIFEDSIKKISNKYSEEEVQILYQIAVSNLKDINFAPNYKSCFEMTMIRMLLFSPFNFEDSKSLKNLPVEHSPTKNSKKKDENEKVAKEKDGDLTNNIIESDKKMLSVEENWDIVVKRLEIDGMTKNLANNILFESRRENNINFLISENLIKMATDKSINKLQEALSSFYGQKINIEISKSDSNLETLHKKNEDNYNARISDANEQIENDDFVKAIKEKFNAKTINNSTKINE
jgi:DNA polymerase-3 subunit gamma/tau